MGCGRSLPQEELLRLVRGPGGEVAPDPERLAEGRGAYVCRQPECGEAAERGLARSFRAAVKLQPESLDFIREWQRSAYTR